MRSCRPSSPGRPRRCIINPWECTTYDKDKRPRSLMYYGIHALVRTEPRALRQVPGDDHSSASRDQTAKVGERAAAHRVLRAMRLVRGPTMNDLFNTV